MIEVTVTRRNGVYRAFASKGHAGFAEEGKDIICSAVSALEINTINSIDTFTDDIIHVENEDGYLKWQFLSGTCPESQLLMNSLMLGLSQIQKNYGRRYLKIITREV